MYFRLPAAARRWLDGWQLRAFGADAEGVYKYASSVRPFNAQTWRDVEQYLQAVPARAALSGHPMSAGRCTARHRYRLRRHHRVEPWRTTARPGAGLARCVAPAIRAAVGDKLTRKLDSGVRRGADILIALWPRRRFLLLRPADPVRRGRRQLAGGQEGDRHFRQRDRPRHGPDRRAEPQLVHRPEFPGKWTSAAEPVTQENETMIAIWVKVKVKPERRALDFLKAIEVDAPAPRATS